MSALCPICFGTFETDEIERHASTCNGTEGLSLSLAERATETSDKDEEVVNCPICFQKFDACEELQRHASECNGASDATEASLNGRRREDVADIPSEFVQNSHDNVLARILKQNHSPLLFFTVFPRVYIQMRRKAREAKERVRTGQTPPTSPVLRPRRSTEEDVVQARHQLAERLKPLYMRELKIPPDGSCQFRAFSSQLYATQAYHIPIRLRCVEYMRANPESFSIFFDGPADFERYLCTMARPGTWGDELTLKAFSDCFRVHVHVVTSTEQNWYLEYVPEERPGSAQQIGKHAFLSYIAPVHYNALELDEVQYGKKSAPVSS